MGIKRGVCKIMKLLPALAICLGVYLMLRITLPYFSFQTDIGFLLTKQRLLHNIAWRMGFYIHIACSLPVLAIGILQFRNDFRLKYPDLHRNLGKLYILLVLIFAAPAGFVLAVFANGGVVAKLSFVLLSAAWWVFTLLAYTQIKKGNNKQHIAMMTRSYALTLSALTLRLYVLSSPYWIHLPAKETYEVIAWLSWVPNLCIAEWIIRYHPFKAKQVSQQEEFSRPR
jgi:uncharacterized membrane protein